MFRFLKHDFTNRNQTIQTRKGISAIVLFSCGALFSPSLFANSMNETDGLNNEAIVDQIPKEDDDEKAGEKGTSESSSTNKGKEWQQEMTGEPQFDLEVTCPNHEIEALLKKYLDLYQYRMLPDLSNLELRRLLEQTEQNITALTSTQGYFSPVVKIKLIPSDQRTDGSLLPLILIHVEPGEITEVKEFNLSFKGNIQEDDSDILIASLRRRLRWAWAMRKDDPFTQSAWSTAKSNMVTRLTSQYYPAGRISTSKATVDPETHSANLSITLDSGPRFYLGDYSIRTLERYSERLVRNFARLKEGDDYLLDELHNAQQRLMDSGYFDAVYVYVLPDDPNPEKATIHVSVQESYYQKMTIGPGYSTDNGPRLTFEYRHNSVPLLDWQLNSSINIDSKRQYIDVSLLSIPGEDYWRWGTYGNLTNEEKNDERTKSVQLIYGKYYTSAKIDRSYFIEYDRARTNNLINNEKSDTRAISINTAHIWRNFNSLTAPRSGWGLGVELGVGKTLGNNSTYFVRTKTRAQFFLPFEKYRNGHFIFRGDVGAVFMKEGYMLPKPLLFLTGGDKTVRGYSYDSIDVHGANDKVTSAGKYLLVGSVEYQRPIVLDNHISPFSWAVFVDTGTVANEWKNLNFYTGVGVGFRWNSPVGPLNADLAYGLKSESSRLHFNIGFTF